VKLHLLVAASALVIGLGSQAFANGQGDPRHNDPNVKVSTAVALNDQDAGVAFVFAKGTDAANSISGTVGMTGLQNVQQNGGANSVLQDGNTLGAILNCSCSNSNSGLAFTTALASNDQDALVLGAVSIGATNKAANGSSASASQHADSGTYNVSASHTKNASASSTGGNGNSSAHDDSAHAATSSGNTTSSDNDNSTFGASGTYSDSGSHSHTSSWAFANNAVQSANSISGTVSTLGLTNISQNVGNNSILQSSNTVAAIIGK
jgi:hypothetical protein